LHILFLSAPGGGLDTNVRVLAPELVQAGHRVSVLYLHFPGEKIPAPSQVDGYTIHHACIGSWHYFAYRATFGLTSLPRVVRAFEWAAALRRAVREIHRRESLDLIELPEVFIPPGWLDGVPYVMRLHSADWTWRQMLDEPASFADAIEMRMERSTLKHAACISSPSNFLANYIRQTCRVSQPIEIIPYPIDTTRFAPGACRDDPPVILFVGRVEKRKGADVLLQAIPLVRQKFPDCQFVFAGSMSAELNSLARDAGEGGVRLLGVRPRDELVQWYQRASIFVAPSLWDNSPNTVYEAMSCGTPVIATRVGGIPELVDDGVTGLLVPPRDAHALADALIDLLRDPARRAAMGKRGREKAVEEYGVEKILSATLTFYKRILQLTNVLTFQRS
jgi:glycosyltransferase involved in cell wall biosynthesis